jgi:hypothetical protein
MRTWLQSARRIGRRLVVILLLAAALSAGSYALAVSPLGAPATQLLRALPGAPQPPPGRVARPPAPVDAAAADGGASTVRPEARAGAANAAARPGGGRGPSLARGLPELGRHAALIAAAIAAFAFGRRYTQRWRRVPARAM